MAEQARELLNDLGLSVPTSDEEAAGIYNKLMNLDDDTLRRALIALGQATTGTGVRWTFSYCRCNLPEEFGARLLRLALPLLERTPDLQNVRSLEDVDEDFIYARMLIRILESMQYAPALEVLTRPGGVPLLGDDVRWSWARFGAVAVRPLAELTRSANSATAQDAVRRSWAIAAIGRIRDPGGVPDLQQLMDDEDPQLRAAAAAALGEIGVPTDLGRFRDALDDPRTPYTDRLTAIQTLAKRGMASDLDALLRFAEVVISSPPPRDDQTVFAAAAALEALIDRSDPSSIERVIRVVEQKARDEQVEVNIRKRVIDRLRVRRILVAKDVLQTLLHDESEPIGTRVQAARALEELDPANRQAYRDKLDEIRERARNQNNQSGGK